MIYTPTMRVTEYKQFSFPRYGTTVSRDTAILHFPTSLKIPTMYPATRLSLVLLPHLAIKVITQR